MSLALQIQWTVLDQTLLFSKRIIFMEKLGNDWNCGHQDCARSFHRSIDLNCHVDTLASGAMYKHSECPELAAPARESRASVRRGKLVGHSRAKYKRNVGRNEFPGARNCSGSPLVTYRLVVIYGKSCY